jgi:hypothetical protein
MTRRQQQRALVVTCLLVLAGCTLSNPFHRAPPVADPAQVSAQADAAAVRTLLATLALLQTDSPARQAEAVAEAKRQADGDAPVGARLRYAALLSVPGHGASDAVAARRQLSEILARPEWLSPSERVLATLLLENVNERLILNAEIRRLNDESESRDREKIATLAKRVQSEGEENSRLKRALEEARRKLEAVTQLERSMLSRGTPPKP